MSDSDSDIYITVKLQLGMCLRNKLTGKLGIIHRFNNLFLYLENPNNGFLWTVIYKELDQYNIVALTLR